LINEGHHVICLDNLFTGAEANIEHLKSNPLFEFVHHDVEFPYHTETLDEIYNLACLDLRFPNNFLLEDALPDHHIFHW